MHLQIKRLAIDCDGTGNPQAVSATPVKCHWISFLADPANPGTDLAIATSSPAQITGAGANLADFRKIPAGTNYGVPQVANHADTPYFDLADFSLRGTNATDNLFVWYLPTLPVP